MVSSAIIFTGGGGGDTEHGINRVGEGIIRRKKTESSCFQAEIYQNGKVWFEMRLSHICCLTFTFCSQWWIYILRWSLQGLIWYICTRVCSLCVSFRFWQSCFCPLYVNLASGLCHSGIVGLLACWIANNEQNASQVVCWLWIWGYRF